MGATCSTPTNEGWTPAPALKEVPPPPPPQQLDVPSGDVVQEVQPDATQNMMVVSPQYVKSVEVHNHTDQAIRVTVVYEDKSTGDTFAEDTVDLEAGASHIFEEKEIDMGSWQAVAPVKNVTVIGDEVLTPVVDAVVALLHVHYIPAPGGPALVQGKGE